MMAKDLVAIWYYNEKKAWASIWKQAAKKWFHRGEVAEGLLIVAELALRKQRTTATRRLGLLRECKEEMEVSVRDFEENINPYLEAVGYHPVTQTPRAMKKLLRKLAAELEDKDE
ncbi:MAG: hypothetical protein ACYSYU_10555 [Planctomycetota bacterium]|jgi:hypothetical protein